MAGNRILHLGEPEQDNNAVRLRFVNEHFLRRDRNSWMRGELALGGHKVFGMANPKRHHDGVNLRMLQDLEMHVLEQASTAVDTAVNDAIHNHDQAVENAEAVGIYRAGP